MRPLWQRASYVRAVLEHTRAELDQLESSVRFQVGTALADWVKAPWRVAKLGATLARALAGRASAPFVPEASAISCTPATFYVEDGSPEEVESLRKEQARVVGRLEEILASRAYELGTVLVSAPRLAKALTEIGPNNPVQGHLRAAPRFHGGKSLRTSRVAVEGPGWFKTTMAADGAAAEKDDAEAVLLWLEPGSERQAREIAEAARASGQKLAVWAERAAHVQGLEADVRYCVEGQASSPGALQMPPAIAATLHNPIGWWHGRAGSQSDDEALAPEVWRAAFANARGNAHPEDAALERVLGADLGPIPDALERAPGWYAAAQRLVRTRRIHRMATAQMRLQRVQDDLGIAADIPREPLVTVAICSNRPGQVRHMAEVIRKQRYPALEVVYVSHGSQHDLAPLRDVCQDRGIGLNADVAPEHYNIGQVRELSHSLARGEWIAKADDDDFYGHFYVDDLLWQARASGAVVVVKGPPILEFEGESRLYAGRRDRWFRYLFVTGTGMLMRRDVAQTVGMRSLTHHDDRAFIVDVRRESLPVFVGDSFNYVYRRGAPTSHNWVRSREQVVNAFGLDALAPGLRPEDFLL